MRRPNARPSITEPVPVPVSQMDSFSFKPIPVPRPSSKPFKHPQPKPNVLTFSLLSILFSLFLFLLFRHHTALPRFQIIIDGGSTGSRIHVFEFRGPRFDFGPNGHSSMRVNPGLSSFREDPDHAGGSLLGLLEFSKKRVPQESWGVTEVRLMATAGLRLLESRIQDQILDSCRTVLRSSGFKFRDDWASVISGSDEGLYAWVVANYALGSLGRDPHQTTGIIELGGASAQVTFVTRESVPPEFSRTLHYGNVTYNLYSNSLLHFGQNVAFDSLKELLVSGGMKLATGSPLKELTIDPCTPKGYSENDVSSNLLPGSAAQRYSSTFHAKGNFSECRAAALTLLQKGKENCSYQHCTLGSTFVPKLHGRFLATENFFYTSQFLGLPPKSHLADLMVAGQQFCEEDWSNIRTKHSSYQEEDLLHYCFSSAYIVALLHDSLGIALDDRRVGYTNQVENTPLDWALGAFILQSSGGTDEENHGWIASIISDSLPNLSLLVGAAILLMFVAWYVLQWRKPYFKTIYDLEKGRYIMTQISR